MATIDYKVIKNFITSKELNLFQRYCHNTLDANKDYLLDPQSFSPAFYNDPLMTALLEVKLPSVQ